MNVIKIAIADDHDMFRMGIAALLKSVENFQVVGIASGGSEAIDICEQQDVDILLLDVEMPGLNGVKVCSELMSRRPELGILALSWHQKKTDIINMVRGGARGYVVKDATSGELITAIKALSEGGSYFSKEVSTILLGELDYSVAGRNPGSNIRTAPLTNRELEILEFISNEFTNKEIADQLYISSRTVETHRRNLIQKLKVKNTVGLVKYYFNFVQRLRKNPA